MSSANRVIVLVDMDCFYCQVEQKLDPSLVGKPLAVVQYNAWKGGGLIAVNYEARAKGVTRHMRGDDAKAKCPDIYLARVPNVRGKADLTRYREAGKRVAEVLQTFTTLLERASVDEAYLDITDAVNQRLEMPLNAELLQNTHIVGFNSVSDFLHEINSDRYLNDSNVKLAIGGVITEEIRAAVYEKTGYRCSAGVAHNKILAKLTAGLHKPNKQTILPHESVPKLYENLSIKKIRSMGGKFGDEVMQKLNVNLMADLLKFSERELQQHFEEKTANFLYNIARGVNNDPVTVRLVSKSIGCCKRFPGRTALRTEQKVRHWTSELSTEIAERIEVDIEENNRKPKQLIVSFTQKVGNKDVASSRSHNLNYIEQEKICHEAYEIIRKNCQKSDGSFGITFLGLNVGKFEDIKSNVMEITSFFKSAPKRISSGSTDLQSKVNKTNNFNDEIDQLAKDIHAVIQENNDSLVKNNSKIFDQTNSIPSTSNLDPDRGDNNDDDSEAELEAINTSVNEANLSTNSIKCKNSFFHKFLNPAKVPKRDFNTSAILDEVVNNETDAVVPIATNDSISHETYESLQSKVSQKHENKKSAVLTLFSKHNDFNSATTSNVGKSYITDDNKELCPECNKFIPVENIVSHLDYHFALKLVRDEAYLYKDGGTVKTEGNVNETNSKSKDKSKNILRSKDINSGNKSKGIKNKNESSNHTPNKKRKSDHLDQGSISKISNFVTKTNQDNDVTDENSEVCPDCSKRIKLKEIPSHFDYHIAKKLHQEINSSASSSTENKSIQKNIKQSNDVKANRNIDKSKKVNKSSVIGKESITMYFKKT